MPNDNYVMTASDWRIKHEGCLCKYTSDGVSSVAVAESFQSSENDERKDIVVNLRVRTSLRRYKTITTSPLSEGIDWSYPTLGTVFVKNSAFLIQRVCRGLDSIRYRQSLHPSAVTIHPFSMDFLPYINSLVEPGTVETLSALWDIRYFNIHEAVRHILNGELLSAPVSSAYTVSLSLKHNKILLYKYKAPVGFIDDGVVNLFDQLSFLKEDIEALGITVLPYSLSDFMK